MLQVTQGCSCAGPGSSSPAACPVLASERRCLIQFLTPQKTHREKHTFEIKPCAGPRWASAGCQDLLAILLLAGPRQGEGCWAGGTRQGHRLWGCWSHHPLSLGVSSSCCSSLRSRVSQPLPPLSLLPAKRPGTLVADPGDPVNTRVPLAAAAAPAGWLQWWRLTPTGSAAFAAGRTPRHDRFPPTRLDAEAQLHRVPNTRGGFWGRNVPQNSPNPAQPKNRGSASRRPALGTGALGSP